MEFVLTFVLEILIGGCLSAIWISLIINKILGYELIDLIEYIGTCNTGVLGFFVCIVCLYVLGWTLQYFSDIIFDNIFEKRIKGSPFKKKEEFHDIRGLVFQNGSNYIIDDIQIDRQLLRLSKLCCLNFALTAIVLLFYLRENYLYMTILTLGVSLISGVSYMHWKKRYVAVMYKFKRAADAIKTKDKTERAALTNKTENKTQNNTKNKTKTETRNKK